MSSLAPIALLAATGLLALSCQSEDEPSGDNAQEQSSPGDSVIAKLDAIVIPVVNFENASAEEAIDFLRQRSMELDPDRDPSRRGISFIVREARPTEVAAPDGSTDSNLRSVPLDYPVSYVAKDVLLLDVLVEVARQGHLDAYLTSVGIIVTPEGKPPFPNPKATEGEVWKELRRAE